MGHADKSSQEQETRCFLHVIMACPAPILDEVRMYPFGNHSANCGSQTIRINVEERLPVFPDVSGDAGNRITGRLTGASARHSHSCRVSILSARSHDPADSTHR
jgi:hypothetical protein